VTAEHVKRSTVVISRGIAKLEQRLRGKMGFRIYLLTASYTRDDFPRNRESLSTARASYSLW
jgi:hypothetical protein